MTDPSVVGHVQKADVIRGSMMSSYSINFFLSAFFATHDSAFMAARTNCYLCISGILCGESALRGNSSPLSALLEESDDYASVYPT